MRLKTIIAMTALAATGMTAQAASTSTTTLGNVYQKLKESPLKLDFYHETGGEKDRPGILNTSIAFLSYKLSDKDKISTENRLVFNNFSDRSADNGEINGGQYSRAVIKYTRSKLLTQENNGVNLSASFEKRFYPDTTLRGYLNQNGLNRLSVKASREFNSLFSLSGTLYGAITDRKDKTKGTTTKNYSYLSMVENFQITDKWYVALVQEPYIGKKTNGKQSANMYAVLETGYQITPEVLAAVYTANYPLAGDKLTVANNGAFDAQEYALYLYINAF